MSKSSNTSLLLPRFFYEFAFTFCIPFSLKHSEKLERNGTAELPSPTVAGCLFYNFLLLLKYLTVDFWGEELVNFHFFYLLLFETSHSTKDFFNRLLRYKPKTHLEFLKIVHNEFKCRIIAEYQNFQKTFMIY